MADGLSFKIRAEIDEALRKVQELANHLAEVDKGADNAEDGLADVGKRSSDVSKVGDEAKDLADELVRVGEEAKDASDGLSDIGSGSKGIKKVKDEADKADDALEELGGEAKKTGSALATVGKLVGAYFTGQQLLQFANSVVKVRSNIESLEISFRTLVGDEQKAASLFQDIRDYAVNTPMQLGDLAEGAKTMLGFGIETEKVMGYLKQLGDISQGNSEKFNSLTLAFSQATSAGKLQGQDLLQLINAGFNPLNEMAKKTGKSIGELKEDMSKGAITADMLADALASATSEGGMFFNALADQSKSINGALSNLQGAWDDMLNEIGSKNQDTFVNIVEELTNVIKHYETYVGALKGIVAAYGTYKGVLMAVTVIERGRQIGAMAKEINLLTKAQKAFNLECLKNPYVLLAAAIVGVSVALYEYFDAQRDATSALERQNKVAADATKIEAQKNAAAKTNLEIARDVTKTTGERVDSLNKLKAAYPQLFKDYDLEKLALADILYLTQKINEANVNGTKYKLQGNVSRTERELKAAKEAYDKTLNPYASYTPSQKKAAKEAYDEAKKANELAKKTLQDHLDGQKKADKVDNRNYGVDYRAAEKEWKDAKAALKAIENDKDKFTRKQYDDAVKRKETAEKAFQAVGGVTSDSKINAATKSAAKDAKEEAAYAEEVYQQKRDAARKEVQLELETRQHILDAQKDSAQKTLAQIQLDYDKREQAIKEREEDLREEKYQAAKKLYETNHDTAYSGDRNSSAFDPTGYEKANIAAARDANKAEREAAIKTFNKNVEASMNEYLKQYGTFQQKLEALKADYENKIESAGTVGEKAKLTQDYESAISQLKFNQLKNSLGWDTIFSDLESKSIESLRNIKDALREALDAKDITAENAKVIVDQLDKVEEEIVKKKNAFMTAFGGELGQVFNKFKVEKERQQNYQRIYDTEIEKERLANQVSDAIAKGIQDMFKERGVSVNQSDITSGNVGSLTKLFENAGGDTSKLTEQFNKLSVSESQAGAAANNANSAMSKMGGKGGGIMATIAILDVIFHTINKNVQSLKTLVQLYDLENTKTGQKINRFAKSSEYATKGWESLKSGDLVGVFANNAVAWDELINNINGNNMFELSKKNEELGHSIDVLGSAISDLTDEIKESTLATVDSNYQKAKELAEQQQTNAANVRLNEAAKWENGSHSVSYQLNRSGDFAKLMRQASSVLGKDIKTSQSFLSLSIEDLKKLRMEVPNLYNEILQAYRDAENSNTGSGIADLIDSDIDKYKETLKQLEDARNESLTGTTFDSLKSDFLSLLNDLDSKTEDFGDKLTETLRNAVINGVMSDFSQELEGWYGDLSDAMVNGLTNDEANILRAKYDQITNEAIAKRDATLSILGLDKESTSLQASSRSVASMSEDTASELNGRFAALQLIGEDMNTSIQQGVQNLANVQIAISESNTILSTINANVLAVNGTLQSIYNTNENGFKELGTKIDSVTSAINNKM